MRALALAVIFPTLCASALAQYAELGVTGGYGSFREGEVASFGAAGGSSEVFELGDGIRIGARMSFDFRGYFAHELAYSWQRTTLRVTTDDQVNNIFTVSERSSSIHNYYYNFTAHATRRGSRVRPFVTGGGGLSTFIPPGLSALSRQGDTELGYNYGAGIKFLASDRYGLRFDVRDHVTGKPFFRNTSGMLHNLETSMTFSFLF